MPTESCLPHTPTEKHTMPVWWPSTGVQSQAAPHSSNTANTSPHGAGTCSRFPLRQNQYISWWPTPGKPPEKAGKILPKWLGLTSTFTKKWSCPIACTPSTPGRYKTPPCHFMLGWFLTHLGSAQQQATPPGCGPSTSSSALLVALQHPWGLRRTVTGTVGIQKWTLGCFCSLRRTYMTQCYNLADGPGMSTLEENKEAPRHTKCRCTPPFSKPHWDHIPRRRQDWSTIPMFGLSILCWIF